MKRTFIQFIKFGIVGVSNTLVSYLLNLFCLFLLDKYDVAYDYVIANTVAFVLSVLWSFYWNERFVFTEHKEDYKSNKFVRLLKMYLSYGFTGTLFVKVVVSKSLFFCNIISSCFMLAYQARLKPDL